MKRFRIIVKGSLIERVVYADNARQARKQFMAECYTIPGQEIIVREFKH